MSKSTKIIAALGVVAGLGVAALPMASFAAEVADPVDVLVEVEPAIAMTIQGNNDANAVGISGVQTTDYAKVVDDDPAGIYSTIAELATLQNTKPSSSAVKMSQNQAIEGTETADQDGTGFLSTIKVWTNDKDGYTLKVRADHSDLKGETNATNTIAAVTGDPTSLDPGTPAFGLKLAAAGIGDNLVLDNTAWKAAPTADGAIRIQGASATGYTGDTTKVLYGVATGETQPVDVYKATLTYTATTAN